MTEDEYFSLHPNPTLGKGSTDAQSESDETEKLQAPPTLVIRQTSGRHLIGNSIYLIITTALISWIDAWSHPVSLLIFAVMVLKFAVSIWWVYARHLLVLSEHGVRISILPCVHWDNLTDFYLEEEVPGESPEMLVVALKGKKLFRAIDYEFVVADLDADRDRIVTWIRFYNKHFRK